MKIIPYMIMLFVLAGQLPAADQPVPEKSRSDRAEGRGRHRAGQSQYCHKSGKCSDVPIMLTALNQPRVAEKVGLDDKQREAIAEKLHEYESIRAEMREKLEDAAVRQAKLMMAKKPDEKALMAVIDEMGRYRTTVAKERVKLILFMRSTLKPEQMQTVHRIMREKMRKRREHGEFRGRHRKEKGVGPQKPQA